ncbi:hypothetical protein BST61_g417 [Cercospora zeina]
MPSPQTRLDPGNIIAIILLLVAATVPLLVGLANRVHGEIIIPADASENISWPYHTFKTANLTPPVIRILGTPSPDPAKDGYLFFAPDGGTAFQAAPIIASPSGDLIWNGPKGKAFGFDVQRYNNEDVLVYWNGTSFPEPIGRGHGTIHILNQHYEEIANVSLRGNFVDLEAGQTFESNIDLHEMYLTEKGTILVLGNNVTQADLRSVGGGEKAWVVEAQVYELDVETNEVLFAWKSLEHLEDLPFSASVYPWGSEGFDGSEQKKAWGYFHINSVASLGDGGYILSSRYLSSAIALDKSGNVIWRVQGIEGNGFTLGEGADFRYQHHIRVANETNDGVVIRLHDSHNSPIDNNTVPASGKFLQVNLKDKEVSLLGPKYYNASGPTFPTAQGSFSQMHNGNYLTGDGWIPVLEEFSPNGTTLATYQFGNATLRPGGGFFSEQRGTLSYRGFKRPWVGCPTNSKPQIVAEYLGTADAPHGTRVYISWNGATEVKEWELWGGIASVSCIQTVEKKGFETVVDIVDVQFVKAKAILKEGAPEGCGNGMESDLVFTRAAEEMSG